MSNETSPTFLITTARSGTQWLAKMLRDAYPDTLRVEHEPVGYRYRPVVNLRDLERQRSLLHDPIVADHFASIDATLQAGRSYVEVGFPAFALYPLLRERFGDRVRILELVRHPIRVAASLVTQRWYTTPGRDDVRDTVALSPWSSGVLLGEYADRWSSMSAFEKGLYYWYEVHAYGREVSRLCPPDRFGLITFKDLVEDEATRRGLVDFLGLPDREAFYERSAREVDSYRHRTPEPIDVTLVQGHPPIVQLAEELGFRLSAVEQAAVDNRYREGAVGQLQRRASRLRARLRRMWR
jgi:hypothetical protein